MNKDIIKIASEILNITLDETKKNCKEIPEINAYYFWNPTRGGISIIINEVGEKLGATSGVSYERHLQAFRDGKRN